MTMPVEMDGEIFLTTAEACQAIGISRDTLNRYVQEGRIKRYKRGVMRNAYYKRSDVDRIIEWRSELREGE
jgi:excisionase family DNA binding protein